MYNKKRPSFFSFLNSTSQKDGELQRKFLLEILKLNNKFKIFNFLKKEPTKQPLHDWRRISKLIENFNSYVEYSQFTYELHLLKLSILDESDQAITIIKKNREYQIQSIKFFQKSTFTYFNKDLNRTYYIFLLAILHNRTEIIDIFFQSKFPDINMSAIPVNGPSFYLLTVSIGNQLMNTLFTKYQLPDLKIAYNNITASMIGACNSLYSKINIVETAIPYILYKTIIYFKKRMANRPYDNILPDRLPIFSTDFLSLSKRFKDFEDILNFYTEELHFIIFTFLVNDNMHFICKLLEYQNILSNTYQHYTPLHTAAVAGSVELLYIYEKYFNIDIKDIFGRTPLDYAYQMRSRKCYIYLRLLNATMTTYDEENIKEKYLFPDEQEDEKLRKMDYLKKLHLIEQNLKKCKLVDFIDIFQSIPSEIYDNKNETCKEIWAVKWIYQYRLKNQKIGKLNKSHFHINSLNFSPSTRLSLLTVDNISIENKTDSKIFKIMLSRMANFKNNELFGDESYEKYFKYYLYFK